MSNDRVDVVLPCLDEAAALPQVLSSLPAGYRAIVVDNGSTDGSADVARAHGAMVIVETTRGFGAAAHAGLCAATADIVAFADADASLDLNDLPRLVARLDSGESDLVLGNRKPSTRGAWPWHARIANRWLSHRVGRMAGVVLHDLGPMRVARREALLGLGITDRRSGYPLEMMLRAAHASWRISQVDVDYHPRIGRSKVTGTVRGTLTAVGDMSRILTEHRG
jgi:glycosyltransferase involved in cell wall biosynthesis